MTLKKQIDKFINDTNNIIKNSNNSQILNLYNTSYITIQIADKIIELPFDAVPFNLVHELLEKYKKEYF